MAKEMRKAVAYLRTSSAANVGQDKDSAQRQREAIAAFAKRESFALVDEFNDEAVSGADAIEARPGFAALLDRIESNGVRVVIVEDASRFARQVLVQELGILALQRRGVQVLTASGDDLTETDDPTKVMMRQVAAAFAQFEKARLVSKLKSGRNRKRAANANGKCEGRKGHAELRPEVVKMAKELRHAGAGRKPKSGVLSLRAIAAELAARGHVSATGNPFNPKSVAAMLAA